VLGVIARMERLELASAAAVVSSGGALISATPQTERSEISQTSPAERCRCKL
jgi:hypothetical protein